MPQETSNNNKLILVSIISLSLAIISGLIGGYALAQSDSGSDSTADETDNTVETQERVEADIPEGENVQVVATTELDEGNSEFLAGETRLVFPNAATASDTLTENNFNGMFDDCSYYVTKGDVTVAIEDISGVTEGPFCYSNGNYTDIETREISGPEGETVTLEVNDWFSSDQANQARIEIAALDIGYAAAVSYEAGNEAEARALFDQVVSSIQRI